MANEISALKEALRIIRDECNSHRGKPAGYSPTCSSCPLSIDGYICGVIGIDPSIPGNYKFEPCNWNLIYDVRLIQKAKEK